jgi:hypothetical protein
LAIYAKASQKMMPSVAVARRIQLLQAVLVHLGKLFGHAI